MTVPDAVGLVGVALYVGAYAGLQTGKLGLADVRYTILNAVGGLAVIFSYQGSLTRTYPNLNRLERQRR